MKQMNEIVRATTSGKSIKTYTMSQSALDTIAKVQSEYGINSASAALDCIVKFYEENRGEILNVC